MKTITYADLAYSLNNFDEVTNGNSIKTKLQGDKYLVFSYSTLIAEIDTNTRELISFDEKKYSQTTSKLQNIIRKEFVA